MTRQTPFIIETMGMINMTTGDQCRCYVQVEINSFSWWFNNKLFYTRKYIRFFFSADRKYFLNREIFMTKQRNIYDAQKEIVYHRHHRWNSNRTRENSSSMHTARFETVRVSVSVAVTRCYSWEWVSPSDIFLTNGFCMWKQGGGASDPAPQTPLHPLAEFCVQFWSLYLEQDLLVLSNSIRYTIIIIKYYLTIYLAKFSKHFLFVYSGRLNCIKYLFMIQNIFSHRHQC